MSDPVKAFSIMSLRAKSFNQTAGIPEQLLGVIREVGGLRRMKDLLEAIAAAQVVQSKV